MINNHNAIVNAARIGCIDLCHAIEKHSELDTTPEGDQAICVLDREQLAWRFVKAARMVIESDANRCISDEDRVLQPLRDIEEKLR